MRLRVLTALLLVALIVLAPVARGARPVILLAAGDIADCSSNGAALTARLIEHQPGTVAAIGDTAYPSGSASDYRNCYAPTWGQFRSRTYPATGNHEYITSGASAYFAYFGDRAHPPGGYYSYQLGSWHIIVLNSNCDFVSGSCGPGSPQLRWLQADLARHRARCTLAYWHHPLFSSGPHGPTAAVRPFWTTLAKAGADIVLNGHDHLYQRFAPINAAGVVDPAHGMREFVVGTGGGPFYQAIRTSAGSRKVITNHWGVLRLQLGTSRYSWQFLWAPSGRVLDAGSGGCR
ncbi:MAG: metallophosphoesterase [Gaiellaceae bacterium]|jgi:alkaline phosphatase